MRVIVLVLLFSSIFWGSIAESVYFSSCPGVVSSNREYVLTNSILTGPRSQTCFTIPAGTTNVTIDGRGLQLGSSTTTQQITLVGASFVTIKNLTLYGQVISGDNCTDLRIEHVTILSLTNAYALTFGSYTGLCYNLAVYNCSFNAQSTIVNLAPCANVDIQDTVMVGVVAIQAYSVDKMILKRNTITSLYQHTNYGTNALNLNGLRGELFMESNVITLHAYTSGYGVYAHCNAEYNSFSPITLRNNSVVVDTSTKVPDTDVCPMGNLGYYIFACHYTNNVVLLEDNTAEMGVPYTENYCTTTVPMFGGFYISSSEATIIGGKATTVPVALRYVGTKLLFNGLSAAVYGYLIDGSSSVNMSNVLVENIIGPNRKFCPGCPDNNGLTAAGIIIGLYNTAVNLTNVTINGVYGGNAALIPNGVPPMNSKGGDAWGILLQSGTLTTDNVVITNVVGGNGAFVSEGNCTGGIAWAQETLEDFVPGTANGTECVASNEQAISECGTYTFSNTIVQVIVPQLTMTGSTCITLTASENVILIGNNANITCLSEICIGIYGVSVEASTNITVTNFRFINTGVYTSGNQTVIDSNSFNSSYYAVQGSMAFFGTAPEIHGLVISNNQFGTTNVAVNLPNPVYDLAITQNYVSNSQGFLVSKVNGFSVTGNVLENIVSQGLYLVGTQGTISSNSILGATQFTAGFNVFNTGPDAIYAADNSVGNVRGTNAELFAFNFTCLNDGSFEVSDSVVSGVYSNCSDTVYGFSFTGISGPCIVGHRNIVVENFYETQARCTNAPTFVGHNFKGVVSTNISNLQVTDLIAGGAQLQSVLVPELTSQGPRAIGISVSGNITIDFISIKNLTVGATADCSNCSDSSGGSAVGILLQNSPLASSDITLSNISIQLLTAGNGGKKTSIRQNDSRINSSLLAVGGFAVGIAIFEQLAAVRIHSANISGLYGGNGATFLSANATTCAGGQAEAVCDCCLANSCTSVAEVSDVHFDTLNSGDACTATPTTTTTATTSTTTTTTTSSSPASTSTSSSPTSTTSSPSTSGSSSSSSSSSSTTGSSTSSNPSDTSTSTGEPISASGRLRASQTAFVGIVGILLFAILL